MGYSPMQWQSTTVANTASNSASIDLGRIYDKIQLDLPALNACSINVKVARTSGGTYNFLASLAAVDVTTGSKQIVLNVMGHQFMQVYCDNAQGAARTIWYRGIAD